MTLRPLALCALLLLPTLLPAQEYAEPDAEDCKDSALLTRMPGCKILQCESKDFDEATLRAGAIDAETGEGPTTTVEGQVEDVRYVCSARLSSLEIHRNAETALKGAGYQTVASGKVGEERGLTARKGGVWVQVTSEPWNEFSGYHLLTVRTKEMAQQMTASAEGWAAEIAKSGRVAVYGLEFDTGKATLRPGAETVLGEMLKLLKTNAALKLRVEGHTDNVGAKAANQKLSEERAAAVVAWLLGKGIDKARLMPQGFGDTKPVDDNGTEAGRAKNRRVELAKM